LKDLTTGKESKLILQFAMPMLLGNVFQQMYNIVDSIIIGNYLGKEALAAVGAAFPILFTLISLVIGFATGATIIIAQYFGAKQIEKVKRTISTMYIFLFVASIILSVLGVIYSGDILRLIQIPDDVFPYAELYLSIYLSGIVFFFGFNGTAAILRGLGDSKTPLYFMVVATITNIVFDLLFVLVFKWGVAGVAIATVISQGGAFITAILYLNKTHKVVHLSISTLQFDKKIFYQSMRIGLPTGLQHTFVSLGLLAVVWIVNLFGTDAIAAYSVAMRIDSLASMPAMNFAAALSSFVGQNLGANKIGRVRAGLFATLKMGTIVSVSISLIAILFAKPLMGLFTQDSNVIAIGAEYLIIVSSFYIMFSTLFIVNGVMRGAGDTIIPMFITLFALWIVRIPLAYYLSLEFGVAGIWWSTPIGWFTGMILGIAYYMSAKWKKKGIVKQDDLLV